MSRPVGTKNKNKRFKTLSLRTKAIVVRLHPLTYEALKKWCKEKGLFMGDVIESMIETCMDKAGISPYTNASEDYSSESNDLKGGERSEEMLGN